MTERRRLEREREREQIARPPVHRTEEKKTDQRPTLQPLVNLITLSSEMSLGTSLMFR